MNTEMSILRYNTSVLEYYLNRDYTPRNIYITKKNACLSCLDINNKTHAKHSSASHPILSIHPYYLRHPICPIDPPCHWKVRRVLSPMFMLILVLRSDASTEAVRMRRMGSLDVVSNSV
jgi:hypothetical protein